MTKKLKGCVAYEEGLSERLRDDAYAAEYANACVKEGKEALLVAIFDIAKARKGIAAIAAETGRSRNQLYNTLSDTGNPRLDGLMEILDSLGLELSFKPKSAA